MYVKPLGFRFPWFISVLLPYWLLYSFYLLFCRVPWALRGGFQRDISFSSECSKVFHSLHIVITDFSIWSQILYRKCLWLWRKETLIEDYSRKPLGVILYYRTIFSFHLGPWSIKSRVLVHPSSVINGFCLPNGALNQISGWLVTSCFVPVLNQHIL